MLIHVRFVKDQIVVDVWFYFWVFYSVSLVSVSVFVLVLCCFGYCSLVVWFEARQLYFWVFFCLFHMNFKIVFFSNSVENVSLMGIINCFGQYGCFHNIDSSYSWEWNVSPFVCIISVIFEQWFVLPEQVLHSPC